ncbi:MAG: hypothetical protein V4693_18020 [Pseudomonadota bacterium]
MESRVAELEKFAEEVRVELRAIDVRLTRIETRLDATATKSDVADLGSTMVKWIVGTVSGLGIGAITVMTFVLNNATPKAQAFPPAPISITVPVQVPQR